MPKRGPRSAPADYVPMKHNGKSVGYVSQDGRTYLTYRSPEVHRCYRYDAYGISCAVLNAIKERGVERICLIEELPSGKHIKHELHVEDWFGIRDNLGQADEQVFYPVSELPVWKARRLALQAERSLGGDYARNGPLDAFQAPVEGLVVDAGQRDDVHTLKVKRAAEDGVWYRKSGDPVLVRHMESFHLRGAIERCRKEGLGDFDQPLKALLGEQNRRNAAPIPVITDKRQAP